MRQTPLISQHRSAGGKLVDFAGWEMPIQYTGVLDEYHTVRSQAGLFDVSHMGPSFLMLIQPTGDAVADHAAIAAINEVRLDHYVLKPWDPPEDVLYPVLDPRLGSKVGGNA